VTGPRNFGPHADGLIHGGGGGHERSGSCIIVAVNALLRKRTNL
jgi:hypothetical protein